MQRVDIPHEYKYVIDRIYFEVNRAEENLAFMLDKNLYNPEFLDSGLYKRLLDRCIDTRCNFATVQMAICKMINVPYDCELQLNDTQSNYYVEF